jgi:hypothetical protein
MSLNLPWSAVLTPFTEPMIAIAIPAAINAYSMAVAPDSSARNARSLPSSLFALLLYTRNQVTPGFMSGNLGCII